MACGTWLAAHGLRHMACSASTPPQRTAMVSGRIPQERLLGFARVDKTAHHSGAVLTLEGGRFFTQLRWWRWLGEWQRATDEIEEQTFEVCCQERSRRPTSHRSEHRRRLERGTCENFGGEREWNALQKQAIAALSGTCVKARSVTPWGWAMSRQTSGTVCVRTVITRRCRAERVGILGGDERTVR